jgi:bile acid:Na+ symporter, BASS family
MTIAELVPLILKLSIMVMVFTIGLGAEPRELIYLLRHPSQLLRSITAMSLVMPVVAVGLVKLFALSPPLEIALVCLALSPVPPILPNKMIKAGGGHAYVLSLLVIAGLFAIVWIPLAGLILDRLFPAQISIPPGPVAKLVLMTVLGPILAGVVVRRLAPALADRLVRPVGLVATLVLLGGLVLILIKAGPRLLALIGDGTLLAIAAFVILGVAVGHLLGGPSPGDRTVLALGTASRHPGIAMAIAAITYPLAKAVPAEILLYLLVSAVVTAPYLMWRKRSVETDAARPERPAPT